MTHFEKRRQLVFGESMSLKRFLMGQLQPWRWNTMLEYGGIRVMRNGRSVGGLSLDFHLLPGDVVVIDDVFGRTYMALRREATTNFRDYVFCPQRRVGRQVDEYLMNQVQALLMDNWIADIPLDVPHLHALVDQLIPLAHHAIRYLILVSHASPFAEILLPMRERKDDKDHNAKAITIESLNEAIERNALTVDRTSASPLVLPRPETDKGLRRPFAVIIRGCSSGRHARLLKRIQEAFGNMVDTVVMPKFLNSVDFQGRRSATQFAAIVEYFQHEFWVTSKTKLDRQGVVDLFRSARLTDWLGRAVPDREWETLVPANVDTDHAPTAEISARIDGRERPVRLRARFEGTPIVSDTWVMTQSTEPTQDEMRSFMLERWIGLPAFQDTEWPYWERMGLRSIVEFSQWWHYRLDSAEQKGQPKGAWAIEAIRYSYLVRTPLLEDGTLIAHYRPVGERGNETNLIDYNDDRIFGRYTHIPKHFAQTL